jgi:hypothetical protein
MMKNNRYIISAGIFIIFILATAGCITPPKGTSTTISSGSSHHNPTTSPPTIKPPTSPVSYLTEVTPFLTTVPTESPPLTMWYSNFPTETPVPADLSCLVYLNTQYYLYNATAVEFNLKNPPMYINYTVIPTNVTMNKYVESPSGGHNYQTVQYSTFSPDSWFEITVMNKTTGTIYLQDGFGTEMGYPVYTSRTFKVFNSDDMLIQFRGNLVTANVGIWVKPIGNFDNPKNMTFAECKYWNQIRANLPPVSTATTPTWTPVNVVTNQGAY